MRRVSPNANAVRSSFRLTVILLISITIIGCGKKRPPKERVVNEIRKAIPNQSQFTVASAKVDFSDGAEGTGVANAILELVSSADLFAQGEADPQLLAAANTSLSNEDVHAPVRKAQAEGITLPREHLDAVNKILAEQGALIRRLNAAAVIRLSYKAGTKLPPITGSVEYSRNGDTWQFSNPQVDQNIATFGNLRTAFPENAIVMGSAEAQALLEKAQATERDLRAAVDTLNRDVLQAVKAETDQLKTSVDTALAMGVTYSGTSEGNSFFDAAFHPLQMQVVGFHFSDSKLKVKFTSGDHERLTREFEGVITTDSKTRAIRARLSPIGPPVAPKNYPDSRPGVYAGPAQLFSSDCNVELAFESNGKATGNYCGSSGSISLTRTNR
jgi:hypothetical protein